MNKILLYATGILLIFCIALSFYTIAITKEKTILKANQSALLEQVRTYKTKSGLNASSIEKLSLSNRQFRKYNADLLATIEDLNLKLKRVVSISESGIKTKTVINTVVHDSLVYLPGKTDTLKCIQFSDPFLKLNGCIENHVFTGKIISHDSLIQVIHRVPRQFLFFKYGTKAIRQEVMSRNPHTVLTYQNYIELRK